MTAALITHTQLLGARSVRGSSRNPASILGAIIFPLLFFALFNIVMRRIMAANDFDYVQLLPSAIVVQATLFAAMSSAYYIANDRLTGFTARLRSMPIHPTAALFGRAFADSARGLISIAAVLIVGVATGMRFEAGLGWLPVYVLVAVLFLIGAALTLGLIGYLAPSPEGASAIASIPYLPLLMLSSGFAPVEDFPSWLQPFVEWQPVTVTIDALRALTGTGDIGTTVPKSIGWSLLLVVVCGFVGSRQMRRIT